MKKFLVGLSAIFICTFAIAETISIDWKVDGNTYAQNTCEYGGTLTVPSTPPTKYGYTFQGWASYLRLEYIESTGTQYIDTGIKLNNEYFKITYDFSRVSTERTDGIGGFRTNAGAFGYYPYFTDSGFAALAWGDQNVYINKTGIFRNTNRHVFVLDVTNSAPKCSLDGIEFYTGVYSSVGTGSNYYIFRCNDGEETTNRTSYLKMYNWKFEDRNGIVRNLIPARRNSDNVVGMYDTVSETFFTNAGTGEFIAGPVVGDIAE